MRRPFTLLFTVSMLLLPSCSVWMESHRPDPVNLHKFAVGESHADIVEKLGPPLTTVKEKDGADCDVYQLYTRGLKSGQKAVIAVGEGAADVLTLGLAEVLFTPAEAATKNEKHPVIFCYRSSKLVRVVEKSGK